MGELHMFFPDRSGISIEGDEEPREFVWTFCDVCNKPQDRMNGKLISRDGESIFWTCEECRSQGFH
jgi:RNase P subunit RPR2